MSIRPRSARYSFFSTTHELMAMTPHSDQFIQDIARWTEGREQFDAPIDGLHLFRQEQPSEHMVCMVEPSIGLVVQGAKAVELGDRTFRYDPQHLLVTSLDVPARMQVLQASRQRPYLGLALKLDLRVLGELMLQCKPSPVEPVAGAGISVTPVTKPLTDALRRLVSLLDEPDARDVLAPLALREVYFRILTGGQGARLRQIVSTGSQGFRIARAIDWLKDHFRQPMQVEQLADLAKMSPSAFHHHFKQLTAMSPLQYQKRLRLHEARRLMLSEGQDAAAAAFQVGYESPTQFSREYARLFGAPPRRDVERLRVPAPAPQPLRATPSP